MSNHQSALKRIRSSRKRQLRNKYQHKTTRNAIRDLRATTKKKDAAAKLPDVVGMIDKLAKNNIIHKNKAGNLKSKLTQFVASL